MGPVEQAIRSRFRTPDTLHTLGQGKPFVLKRIDHEGIDLLLGKQRNYTPLGWVAVVLREAGVARIDQGPPLRVQLTERFK